MRGKLWRFVQYTDDGCSVYQCLNCKEGWECRTPVSNDWGAKGWDFCPYCGCKWDGQKQIPYEAHGKHAFVAHVYGRELSWRGQPRYRYNLFEWVPIIDQWYQMDWSPDVYAFDLVSIDKRGHRSAASTRAAIKEKIAATRKSWDGPFGDGPRAIRIILERRDFLRKNDLGYDKDHWVTVREFLIKPEETS